MLAALRVRNLDSSGSGPENQPMPSDRWRSPLGQGEASWVSGWGSGSAPLWVLPTVSWESLPR